MSKKAATKTISWRILASVDTFLIGLFCIHILDLSGTAIAGAIAAIEIINKLLLYYLHECFWEVCLPRWRKKQMSVNHSAKSTIGFTRQET